MNFYAVGWWRQWLVELKFFNLLPLLKKLQISLSILFILYLFDKNWKIEGKLSSFNGMNRFISFRNWVIIKKKRKEENKITWNSLIWIFTSAYRAKYIFASLTEINYDTLFITSAEYIIISQLYILKILGVNSFLFVYGQSVSD